MASTIITRTPSSAGNRKTMTFSAWVKRSGISTGRIFSTSYSGENNQFWIKFGSETLGVYSRTGGSYTLGFDSTAKYRDTNGWYHLVVAIDTTQSTSTDRLKVYVNNSLISGTLGTTPSQNLDVEWNVAQPNDIGGKSDTSGEYFDGLMSHVHFIDGTAYDASYFGQYDANGVWKIKTSPSVTYGTNGFFILKNGNSVTDQSGNSNNFTVGGGTLTNTEDNPSNVFATGNPLYYYNGAYSAWSNSNNTCYTNAGAKGVNRATLGASAGKYYWEVKIGASDGAGNIWQGVGITGEPQTGSTDELGNGSYGYGYWGEDGTIRNNDSNIATYSTFTTNDVISVALDMDNNKLYFAKNGTWQNSANPSSGTNGISINTNPTDGFYFPAWGDWDSTNRYYFYTNFGNGYFGTTAVASAGTNSSGIGIFEYDVPTGYTALSTKGLNL